MLRHNLGTGGQVWGCSRTVPKKGPRTLSFLGAHFVPNPSSVADLRMDSIGRLLQFPAVDFQLIFELSLTGEKFEPPNGDNSAVWVSRKKLSIPCGRLLKMK
jgi:hypothetical protein